MRFYRVAPILLGLFGAAFISGQTATGQPPRLDKQKLESYLRYAEGFAPAVKFTIEDPVSTPWPGYYRLRVHLSKGEAKQDKVYYVTVDGKHVIGGPVWDVDENPFLETLDQLPTVGPSFGPADAKITLVVFSDFQCPYCRAFARVLTDTLPKKYPKDIRVIFKDFPIESLHPWAEAAAEAGHCVGDGNPGAFWAFHDWIFQNQGEINPGNLRDKTLGFAKEHNLNAGKIAGCMDTHSTKPEVEKSLQEGRALEIQQTPTFYLNGRPVPGALPWADLDTLIQMELNRPKFIPDARAGK